MAFFELENKSEVKIKIYTNSQFYIPITYSI